MLRQKKQLFGIFFLPMNKLLAGSRSSDLNLIAVFSTNTFSGTASMNLAVMMTKCTFRLKIQVHLFLLFHD